MLFRSAALNVDDGASRAAIVLGAPRVMDTDRARVGEVLVLTADSCSGSIEVGVVTSGASGSPR